VEARGQGRVGVSLVEVNVKRGSAGRNRVTPACPVRTRRVRKPSKSGLGEEPSWQTSNPVNHNGMEGRFHRKVGLATGEGKTLKAETQGRYRHETRPERLRAE
jgi:hypothetical protein